MKNHALQNDLLKAREHDNEALICVLNKFDPLIKKHARILNYDDAASDIIVALIEKIYSLKVSQITTYSEGQLVLFCKSIIRNIATDIYRKRLQQCEQQSLTEDAFYYDCSYYFPCEAYSELLTTLNDKQRFVIYAHYFYGYSIAEIGILLGISRQAVNKIHNRALANLRREVDTWRKV